jgi:hypothetical protein
MPASKSVRGFIGEEFSRLNERSAGSRSPVSMRRVVDRVLRKASAEIEQFRERVESLPE